jgi:hypothetical protein
MGYDFNFTALDKHMRDRYKGKPHSKKRKFTDKQSWESDPVITDDEAKDRKALIDRAKAGCREAIETLKRAPFSLKLLVLNGQKII